jgi:ABC-2 type transport system permease protein
MFGLVINELEKLHLRKKIIITTIIFGLVCGLMCFGIAYMNNKNKEDNNPKTQLRYAQQDLKELNKEYKNSSKDDKVRIGENISSTKQLINQLKLQINEKKLSNKELRRSQIKELSEQRKRWTKFSPTDNEKEGVNKQLNEYTYKLKHNIKSDSMNDGKISGYTIVAGLFMANGNILLMLIVIIVIFASDIVSGEYTPPTMKLLLTKPVSRRKILISKFIAAFTATVVIVLSIEFIAFIVMGLIYGFGNGTYPVSVGTKYHFVSNMSTNWKSTLAPIVGSSGIDTVAGLVLKSFLYQILFLGAAVAFCFMLSTIAKSSTMSISLSIIISVALLIASHVPLLSKVVHLFFNAYGDPIELFTHSTETMYNNPYVNPSVGAIVLCGWILICYIISDLVFTKKDALI